MVEINIFRNASDAIDVEDGHELFRVGDPGDDMWAVLDGKVEILRDGRSIEIVGAGGILGELAIVDPGPRAAAAVVRGGARVVRVGRDDFLFLVHEHPTFALKVMTIMAERLRRMHDTPRS